MKELKFIPEPTQPNTFYAIGSNSHSYWVTEDTPANVVAYVQDNVEGSRTVIYKGISKLAAIAACEASHEDYGL